MNFNYKNAKNYLNKFDFVSLFIEELGWNYMDISPIYLTFDNYEYTLSAIAKSTDYAIAEKCGMIVYSCHSEFMPLHQIRRQIDQEIIKYSYEHLIIYIDSAQKEQVWQWSRKEKNQPLTNCEQRFYINQSNDLFLQKLAILTFSLDEEKSLNLHQLKKPNPNAFGVDKVTNKFYNEFKKQYDQFLTFIQGIDDLHNKERYAYLMLNRLIFIYFMEKKGFFDNNKNYLAAKLKQCQLQYSQDQFYSFYRDFLIRLFHEGLGKQNRPNELINLFGKVPYLNCSLYEQNFIEKQYTELNISDVAFENIFTFFDNYDWYLDDISVKNKNEINPDVLGYIFEKYTNQKQMGAYYTKQDITEYISKNCIIPYLFDSVFASNQTWDTPLCSLQNGELIYPLFKGGLRRERNIFCLLKKDPDRYIYNSVRFGVNLPLPPEIERGINDISQRNEWNKSAFANYALPTETWREHINRRERYFYLIAKITNNEITSINDFITYNLNINQFIQDVIANCNNPQIIWQFYQSITQITILDPTCGSGAFLFAALNILEPIYEVCLENMQIFIDDDYSPSPVGEGAGDEGDILHNFKQVINQINSHNNRKYFILKSIIINNLYGVDIMQEATEICKLRLYLKLVGQIEPNYNKPNIGIESLPNIDFNIKSGNSLVGFTTYEGVKKAGFNQQLSDNLDELKTKLNLYLAKEYGIDINKKQDFKKWKESHQPFHWFIEFYHIINKGGFDVIIGNPPYIEYSKVKKDYEIKDYETLSSGNIYAQVIERGTFLTKKCSYVGWIVPISSICTKRTQSLQKFIKTYNLIYAASFDIFPSRLFEGVAQRLTILLLNNKLLIPAKFYLTKYYRWKQEERANLLNLLHYEKNNKYIKTGCIPRINLTIAGEIIDKISVNHIIKRYLIKTAKTSIYVHRVVNNFIKAINFKPYFKKADGIITYSDDFKILNCQDEYVKCLICLLNSNLFYFYWRVYGDGFHCGFKDIEKFACSFDNMSIIIKTKLNNLADQLNQDFQKNSVIKSRKQVNTGKIELQTFFISKSKPIIDEIDKVLAQHYGFTDEELDFIINYDIKYRMGKDSKENNL